MREILIEVYLLVFKMVFSFMKLFPLKDKVTFVVSFEQNSLFVYKEMKQQRVPFEMVFLSKKSCYRVLKEKTNEKVVSFETTNIFDMVKSIYHLATSKHVIIDNYYGFLAAIHFKENVQCTQLWHAAGAVKTFGLKDRSISHRSHRAQERFEKVYEKFDKVVVGSEAFANIFMEAFHLPAKNILRTGFPRTDLFYNKAEQNQIILNLVKENPALKYKKIILYAPTYRENQLDHFDLQLDIKQMYEELSKDYVLLLKLHPAVKIQANIEEEYKGFVFDYSTYRDVNELLLITDILISDYSSIPYEFSLLKRPMIFFPYDLEEYKKERGLWGEYEKLLPGPVVFNTKEMIDIISRNAFDYAAIEECSKKWNMYSDGHSSKKLVDSLFIEEEQQTVVRGEVL